MLQEIPDVGGDVDVVVCEADWGQKRREGCAKKKKKTADTLCAFDGAA